MQQGNKPFPPFGAILNQFQLTSLTLKYALHIHCGKNGWTEAKQTLETGQLALCLPVGAMPLDYHWPVQNLTIIIDDSGGMDKSVLIQLAECCLSNRAKIVWIYSHLYPEGLYFTS